MTSTPCILMDELIITKLCKIEKERKLILGSDPVDSSDDCSFQWAWSFDLSLSQDPAQFPIRKKRIKIKIKIGAYCLV